MLACVIALAACDIDCGWFAPDASRTRRVGGHEIEIEAQGTRHIGVEGIGAPHAFGILWPAIDGYGYHVDLRIGARPTVRVGSAGFPEDRLPTETELQRLADAVEVAFAPQGDHIAFRRAQTTGWRVLHLLPVGAPFASNDSDRLAEQVVAADALAFDSLAPAETIALRVLASADERRAHADIWAAVDAQPTGAPWDAALLAIWPTEMRAHAGLTRCVSPGSRSTDKFRTAAITAALDGLPSQPGHADLQSGLVRASQRDEAIATLDAALLALLPRADVRSALRARLGERGEHAVDPALRTAVAARALELLRSAGEDALLAEDSIALYEEATGRDDAPELYAAVLSLWPTNDSAHEWLLARLAEASNAHVAQLDQAARAHLADPDPRGMRAAMLRCRLAMNAGDCASIPALVPRAGSSNAGGCYLPAACR